MDINIPGIIWYEPTNKWIVDVRVDGKFKCLGLFEELADAIKARDEARDGRTQDGRAAHR